MDLKMLKKFEKNNMSNFFVYNFKAEQIPYLDAATVMVWNNPLPSTASPSRVNAVVVTDDWEMPAVVTASGA